MHSMAAWRMAACFPSRRLQMKVRRPLRASTARSRQLLGSAWPTPVPLSLDLLLCRDLCRRSPCLWRPRHTRATSWVRRVLLLRLHSKGEVEARRRCSNRLSRSSKRRRRHGNSSSKLCRGVQRLDRRQAQEEHRRRRQSLLRAFPAALVSVRRRQTRLASRRSRRSRRPQREEQPSVSGTVLRRQEPLPRRPSLAGSHRQPCPRVLRSASLSRSPSAWQLLRRAILTRESFRCLKPTEQATRALDKALTLSSRDLRFLAPTVQRRRRSSKRSPARRQTATSRPQLAARRGRRGPGWIWIERARCLVPFMLAVLGVSGERLRHSDSPQIRSSLRRLAPAFAISPSARARAISFFFPATANTPPSFVDRPYIATL